MKEFSKYKDIQTYANAIARRNGYGRADSIIPGKKCEVIKHIKYGFRKKTTDEYVPNAYLKNFGWKNTYYQNAITTVSIKNEIYNHFFDPCQ